MWDLHIIVIKVLLSWLVLSILFHLTVVDLVCSYRIRPNLSFYFSLHKDPRTPVGRETPGLTRLTPSCFIFTPSHLISFPYSILSYFFSFHLNLSYLISTYLRPSLSYLISSYQNTSRTPCALSPAGAQNLEHFGTFLKAAKELIERSAQGGDVPVQRWLYSWLLRKASSNMPKTVAPLHSKLSSLSPPQSSLSQYFGTSELVTLHTYYTFTAHPIIYIYL